MIANTGLSKKCVRRFQTGSCNEDTCSIEDLYLRKVLGSYQTSSSSGLSTRAGAKKANVDLGYTD